MSGASGTPFVECTECGTRGSGRFCSECAAPLTNAACKECSKQLVPGALFCHHCGASVRAQARARPRANAQPSVGPRRAHTLSWAVAVGAFITLAGFVVSQRSVTSASAEGGAAAPVALGDTPDGAVRAPDISAMSPRERAERLFDRAMMAKQSGKLDSATFFASMATLAYSQLGELALDDHYDLGRLALLSGSLPAALAEADTILSSRPTHLLGLMLAEDAARASGNVAKASAAHAKLLASAAKEQRDALPEYRQHAAELAAALGAAADSGTRAAAAAR